MPEKRRSGVTSVERCVGAPIPTHCHSPARRFSWQWRHAPHGSLRKRVTSSLDSMPCGAGDSAAADLFAAW